LIATAEFTFPMTSTSSRPRARVQRGLIVDSFCGGGGASTGIEAALGRPVDIAINHDEAAIEMHVANHPRTKHFHESVWKVDPVEVCGDRPVELLWLSPDCTHFSRAKGGKPVKKSIRGLAWLACTWASKVRPRVICLENVREFQDFGPLLANGRPCPQRKGKTFRAFVSRLRNLGYDVDWRVLNASDFGAPTHRRRLFLVARCDGLPIRWPSPTHGPGRAQPWRTAAECIDWSIPCPSIFARKRPLADATMRRIANGLRRYVFESKQPFIVRTGHWSHRTGEGFGFRGQGVHEPLATVCATNDKALVLPYVVGVGGRAAQTEPAAMDAPTNTATSKADRALVVPHVISIAHGDSGGRREYSPLEPLGTLTKERGHAVVTPCIVPVTHHGDDRAHGPDEPLRTVTAAHRGEFALVAPFLSQYFGGMTGKRLDEPTPTVTAIDHNALVAAWLEKFYSNGAGADARDPMPTATSGGQHIAEVCAFLVKYFGACDHGQPVDAPLHTLTGKPRFGLVEIEGTDYQIVDIGLRMLTPRELARAQGFPDSYVLTGNATNQIARIGNAVVPHCAEAIVRANLVEASSLVGATA
jgi:DNA (cytosine-5)-methyltransferase 1